MRAVIVVIGKDRKGILAQTATICWKSDVNIVDLNQKIMEDFFTMTILADITELNKSFADFREELTTELDDVKVLVMNEDIFKSMHRI